MIYALDTNIVSYMLKGDVNVIPKYSQALGSGNQMVIPPIVFYEVRRGLLAKKMDRRLAKFSALNEKVLQVDFDMPVWEKAAQISASLYQQGKSIEDADIFIAAYCIVNDFTLVTNNTRHFERVDGLKFVNWK